jgi:hypothetical protein
MESLDVIIEAKELPIVDMRDVIGCVRTQEASIDERHARKRE